MKSKLLFKWIIFFNLKNNEYRSLKNNEMSFCSFHSKAIWNTSENWRNLLNQVIDRQRFSNIWNLKYELLNYSISAAFLLWSKNESISAKLQNALKLKTIFVIPL